MGELLPVTSTIIWRLRSKGECTHNEYICFVTQSLEKSVVLFNSNMMAGSLFPAAFPFHHVRQMWATWKPWEGYRTAEAGQMFLGTCPSQCVSYYPVHAKFTLVFKHGTLASLLTGVERFQICAPLHLERNWKQLKESQLWLLKLALKGVGCTPQDGHGGVWRLSCQEKVLRRRASSFMCRLRSFPPSCECAFNAETEVVSFLYI